MPEPETPGGMIAAAITLSVNYARAGERLAAAIAALLPAVASVQKAVELEPVILPEATAALEHITQASEALQRAFVFIETQFSVRSDALTAPEEGGTTDDDDPA